MKYISLALDFAACWSTYFRHVIVSNILYSTILIKVFKQCDNEISYFIVLHRTDSMRTVYIVDTVFFRAWISILFSLLIKRHIQDNRRIFKGNSVITVPYSMKILFILCIWIFTHMCILLLHCTKGSSEKQIKSRPNLSFAIGNNRVWFLNLSIILYIHICVNPLYILSNAFLQCCGSSDFLDVDPDLIFRIGADPIFLTDTDSIF